MKLLQKFGTISMIFLLIFSLTQCKTQAIENEVPFTIKEKNYFYWAAGKKGTNGVNINIVGEFNTTNLGFTTIYFQNREYKVIPQFNGGKFTLTGSYSILNTKNILMDEEGKSKDVAEVNKIPFELKNDEALIIYTINGRNHYYKITGVKKMATIYYP